MRRYIRVDYNFIVEYSGHKASSVSKIPDNVTHSGWTENADVENEGGSKKSGEWKSQEWKTREENAGVENGGGPIMESHMALQFN